MCYNLSQKQWLLNVFTRPLVHEHSVPGMARGVILFTPGPLFSGSEGLGDRLEIV